MSSNFSGALQLTDLNDFITPSQDCIKPVQVTKIPERKGLSKIQVSTDGSYMEVDVETGKSTKLQKAQITLNDCLACSGCITSAETVLVAMQSHEQLYKFIEDNKISADEDKSILVVSVSPQARASLAVKHELNAKEAASALSLFFKSLGAQIVLDTTYARELVLFESAQEFIDRYRENTKSLPMLTSSCPGWICYAEKTHGEMIIPHISTVKSPQQVNGTLVKDCVSKFYNKKPNQVYHVAIMPCYDKKLEASREDFYDEIYSTRDVDLVLTSTEVELMLANENATLKNLVLKIETLNAKSDDTAIPQLKSAYLNHENLLNHGGGGSGGYLEYVFRKAAKIMFDRNVDEIKYKSIRNNKDFREVTLRDDEGNILLNFAAAYGFRSIQNLVQKMKRGKCTYHFVEVMACPSGCLNGGGQIKSPDGDREQQKELLNKVTQVYNEVACTIPGENQDAKQELDSLQSNIERTEQLLHTQYRAVQRDESLSLMVKW